MESRAAPRLEIGRVSCERTKARMGPTHLLLPSDTIPRASGDVILGGFKTDNDWTAHAVASQTTDILERCIAMAPDLIPETLSRNREPRILVEELRKLIIEEGAGLRPARKGGVRIESETTKVGNDSVPVVHHYG